MQSGKLDFLVNNAGRDYFGPGLDTNIEIGNKIFDVNFWGVMRVFQAFASLLVLAKGTVVTIGSANGYLHMPYLSMIIRVECIFQANV